MDYVIIWVLCYINRWCLCARFINIVVQSIDKRDDTKKTSYHLFSCPLIKHHVMNWWEIWVITSYKLFHCIICIRASIWSWIHVISSRILSWDRCRPISRACSKLIPLGTSSFSLAIIYQFPTIHTQI